MPTGSSPSAVAVGDFNGDGDQDIAVTVESNNRVYIYNGHGDGTFSFAVSYVVGTQPVAITAVDLNHDGKLDLAVANRQSGTVSILIGNGNSSFATAVGYNVGSLPVSIAAANYDPDGFVDLRHRESRRRVRAAVQSVRHRFTSAKQRRRDILCRRHVVSGRRARHDAGGIFTAGGDSDFVITSFTSNDFLVYLGDGGGGFPIVKGPLGDTRRERRARRRFRWRRQRRRRDLTRRQRRRVACSSAMATAHSRPRRIYSEGAIGAHPYSGTTADFDGDGHPDIAFANYSDNSIAVLRTRTVGNGGFDSALTFTGGLNGPSSIASADFNHDGKADLVVVNAGGDSITVFLNRSIPTDRVFMDGFDFN